MPIETRWLVNGRVIYARLLGTITWDDITVNDMLIRAYLDNGISPVHIILDRREQTEPIPFSVRQIIDAMNGLRHPHHGQLVIVGQQFWLVHLFMRAANMLTGIQVSRVETVADTLYYLAKNDPTLPDIQSILDQLDE